jgi:hypothetical protein
MSMSLDGFIAGPQDSIQRPLGEGGERLHEWIFGGQADRSGTAPRTSASGTDGDILDEFHLVPVLLGEGGRRLFENAGPGQIDLERTRIIESQGVTHLSYRVVK